MKKSIKIIKITFCTLVIAVISVIGLKTVLNNEKMSYKEGRKLKTFPKLTLKAIKKDTYFNDLTDAFADQLEYREEFIKYYYLLNMQRYVGGVVEGKDNVLFLSPLIVRNKEHYKEKLKQLSQNEISNIAKNVTKLGAKFIFLSIPRKDVVMNKYLPSTYISGVEDYIESIDILKENVSKEVIVIDAYDIFKINNTYDVFYKTDHHLNIRGAYELFEELIKLINKDGYNIQVKSLEEEYEIKSQVINGSYNRKIGQKINAGLEELTLVPKNNKVKYTRWDDSKLVNTPVFGTDNTYASAYMGKDVAETVIKTNIQDAPNILYVGSSFTNILEALSVYKFNTMVSVDYRHNTTGKSIEDYVKEYNIDYVVFMPSQQNNALSITIMKEHLGLKRQK